MEDAELEALVRNIVKLSKELKDKYTKAASAPVNYACVFSHSKVEYDGLIEAAGKIGKVIDNTPTGPVFLIKPIETVAGRLKLLKIRIPDPTRPERGDADFSNRRSIGSWEFSPTQIRTGVYRSRACRP